MTLAKHVKMLLRGADYCDVGYHDGFYSDKLTDQYGDYVQRKGN